MNHKNRENKELKELSIAFAALNKEFSNLIEKNKDNIKIKEVNGAYNDTKTLENDKNYQKMCDLMYSMSNNIHDRIDNLNKRHWDHVEAMAKHCSIGHFPVLTASQMKKALGKMGLEEDFSVIPTKNVYATEITKLPNNVISVNFSPKNV